MEWVVITAPSVDEAKERALDELGVDEAEAEFVVEEEPRPGLFGRTRGEARVRARVAPRAPRPKVERRERRRRSKGPGDADRSKRKDRGGRQERGGEARAHPTTETSSAGDQPVPSAPPEPTTPSEPTPSEPTPPEPTPPEPVPAPEKREEPAVSEITLDQQGETVADFLSGLLDAFDVDGELTTTEIDDENLEVSVQGTELGLLIGQRGQTLQAISEIARAASMQALEGRHPGRVHIDIAGYRQRRRDALSEFARGVAEEVRSSGVAKALEPMSAADRKVVHDTVNEIDGVSTISEGEDARRRVVIEPAG